MDQDEAPTQRDCLFTYMSMDEAITAPELQISEPDVLPQ